MELCEVRKTTMTLLLKAQGKKFHIKISNIEILRSTPMQITGTKKDEELNDTPADKENMPEKHIHKRTV